MSLPDTIEQPTAAFILVEQRRDSGHSNLRLIEASESGAARTPLARVGEALDFIEPVDDYLDAS